MKKEFWAFLLVMIAMVLFAVSLYYYGEHKSQAAVDFAAQFSVESMVESMVDNYEANCEGIDELIKYAASTLDDHCGLQLVLKGDKVKMFYVYNFMWFGKNNPKRYTFNNLMPFVGLTQEELDTIISKLHNVNCLSVELMKQGSDFAKVLYWENSKFGFYYHIFYEPVSDAELEEDESTMRHCVPYSNRMYLEYNLHSDEEAVFPERELFLNKWKE